MRGRKHLARRRCHKLARRLDVSPPPEGPERVESLCFEVAHAPAAAWPLWNQAKHDYPRTRTNRRRSIRAKLIRNPSRGQRRS